MVTASGLEGRRILVVEDEWLLADAISDAIQHAGGTVVGPVATVDGALVLLSGETAPDGATLNIRLADGESFPVADELARLAVPFLFASANGRTSLPSRFARRAMVAKPFSARHIVQALEALLA